MNGDEASRIVSEVASLRAMLVERERGAAEFRLDMRTGLRETVATITEHATEDTRRFDKAATTLDEKVSGLYEHLQEQADKQRARAWQITGVVIMATLAFAGVLIAAHKSGML